MNQIFFLYTFFVLILVVHGSHFLGGTITWHPLNESATGTPVAIVIIQTYSWTYALMPCTSTMIATNQLVPNYAGVNAETLTCIANCGAGSTGYSPIAVIPYCTDFSAPVGTTVGQRSDTISLQSGDDFTVAFQDSAWRPLTTAPSAAWSIATTINLQPRSDNGLYNNAPVATVMSPIYIPVNQPALIYIPVADADGDPMRCRWSNDTNGVDECGGVCPPSSLPPGTVIYSDCIINITGQVIGNWFGVALMVEDFINLTSTTPLSAVPVQFLVEVVNASSCGIPPEIIGLPEEGSCTLVIVGQPFTSELIAINNCGPSVTIVDIATLSFPGMIKSDLAEINSTEYYKNITWTPTSAQLGYQVICALAFDSQNAQSAQYCFKFYVSTNFVSSCPGDPVNITTSMSTASTSVVTTTKIPASINWPLIGSIIGLVFLAALTLLSCLFWRYCCLPGVAGYTKKRVGFIELYHIEQCIDPDCYWSYRTNSSEISPTSRNEYVFNSPLYGTVNSSTTTRTMISNSLVNRKGDLTEDVNEPEMIVIRDRSPLTTIIDRVQRQLKSSVTVTKIRPDYRLDPGGDSSIKNSKRAAKDQTNNSPIINLRNREDMKVSQMKTATTQKTVSTDKRVPKKNDTIESDNEIHSTFQSTKGVRIVRVNNQVTKPPIQHSSQPVHNQITRSEDTIHQSGEPSQPSEIIKKTNVCVIHKPSSHRQIDKNDLSRKDARDKTPGSVSVERVQTKKKKKKVSE